LVWEIDDFRNDKTNDSHRACGALTCAINAAFEIHKKYFYLKRSLKFSCPEGFGVGIAIGTAYRIRVRTLLSNLNEDDYVGYPMNAGSRLQKLAQPYGIVLDSTASRICRKCPHELLRAGFPGYELELVDPKEEAIQDAAKSKGLNYKDRRFFKYLTSPSARDYL